MVVWALFVTHGRVVRGLLAALIGLGATVAGLATSVPHAVVPGAVGAAVVLLHGSHGSRTGTLAQLRMLAAAGYGVLAFDARGHGLSAGQSNALGWRGVDDIAGAVNFLGHQPGSTRGGSSRSACRWGPRKHSALPPGAFHCGL